MLFGEMINMPAKKIYNTDEELSEAMKENYRRYNKSDKRKSAKERFKERHKDDVEMKAAYYESRKQWYNSLPDERKEEIRVRGNELAKIRRREDPRTPMLADARKRAKQRNLEYDLTKDDVTTPELCPVLGIPLFVGTDGKRSPNSPSLDRIDNNKGYTKDNIAVISLRANTLKNDANVEELRAIVKYMEENLCLGTE